MPLMHRKAGFTQHRTKSGNVMCQTPCGKKVRPSDRKCRECLSKILDARSDLNCLSDSVKTASPPHKTPALNHRLRSEKNTDQQTAPATPSSCATPSLCADKNTVKASPSQGKSPNAHDYFRKLRPKDQFLSICDSCSWMLPATTSGSPCRGRSRLLQGTSPHRWHEATAQGV